MQNVSHLEVEKLYDEQVDTLAQFRDFLYLDIQPKCLLYLLRSFSII